MVRPQAMVKKLEGALEQLNKAERRVAEVVLADREKAVSMSMAELAAAASSSEPTVLRLARRFGCSGFSDFKRQLAIESAIERMFVFDGIDKPPEEPVNVAKRVHQLAVQALSIGNLQLDHGALKKAADAVVCSSRVFCFGVGGSSANMASEAENRLFRYDIHAVFSSDHYRQLIMAGLCDSRDSVLTFSVTGCPAALVEAVQVAAQNGATTISVTRPMSPLASISDIVLPLDIPDPEEHVQIPHRSRYGQMYVLDCLATLIASARIGGSAEKLRNLRAMLLDVNNSDEAQPIGD